MIIVILLECREELVTLGIVAVNNGLTLCLLKVGTVEKAKSLSDLY